jgi:predicted Rossmann fold nucleotide-binding protein DprA/Smf involved in DNA uptake
MKVGFTGTSRGMTMSQKNNLAAYLASFQVAVEFHHGCCVGADADAHQIALKLGIPVHIHPPKVTTQYHQTMKAECPGAAAEYPAKPHLERNHDIVDAVYVLVAAPWGPEQVRSGTWATVRYARRTGKVVVFM